MSLDEAVMDRLRTLQAQGDAGRAPYYQALQAAKDPYGRLALSVVRQDLLAGTVAYSYALEVAKRYCRPIDQKKWIDLSVTLMRADYQARTLASNFDANSPSLQWFVIRDYHAAAFRQVCGLPALAWTAWIPLFLQGTAGDAQLWRRMLTGDFLRVATDSVRLAMENWSRNAGVSNDMAQSFVPLIQNQPPVVTGSAPPDPGYQRCMKALAPEQMQVSAATTGERLGAFYFWCLGGAANVVGSLRLPAAGVYGPDGWDLTAGDVYRRELYPRP